VDLWSVRGQPFASFDRSERRRWNTGGPSSGGAGASWCASATSAAAWAPGSPKPIPDGRGAPTPALSRWPSS